MTDSPIDRLRADHIPLYEADENNECLTCGDSWPCDTIAALDALEARLAEYRKTATNMRELHDQLDDENEALQARLDAATALIWGAQMDEHMIHGASLKRAALRACEHPNCAPYRAWLAGDKEEHGEL